MEKIPRINILPEDVYRKIAAGEVVDRPSSVVKELVENSLDAQAKKIEIHIKSAGKELISVKDDGVGIYVEDMEKAILPHATSKITCAQDLMRISSFGFRGEALYSISSVSNMTLRSRVDGQDVGWEIEVRAGRIVGRRPVSMQKGTEVLVRALFFNTPGRRKFLKSDRTENGHIIRTVLPYILTYPQKDISLYIDGKGVLASRGNSREERICSLFGIEKGSLISSQSKFGEVIIESILGSPQLRRVRRDQQFLFVNDRPVYHQGLLSAINKVYRAMMPGEYYPVFFMWLTLPSEMIDVNIHPQKREVKFRSEKELISQIARYVEKRIRFALMPSSIKVDYHGRSSSGPFLAKERIEGQKVEERRGKYALPPQCKGKDKDRELFRGERGVEQGQIGENTGDLVSLLGKARPVGVVFRKYGLLEVGDGLLVVDMHAGQERVNYERLLKGYRSGRMDIQELLSPEVVSLSIEEMMIWEKMREELEKMGFHTSLWAEDKIAIHSHPVLVRMPREAVKELLGSEELRLGTITDVKEFLARKACRSSIMAGDNLGIEHLQQLQKDLLSCSHPLSCPHGRPTIIFLPEKRLDDLFLRGM